MRVGRTLLIVATVAMTGAWIGQSTPDFSGTWTFVEVSGGSTRGTPAPGNQRTPNISGAAFNCGQECTITQKDDKLTISRPAPAQGAKPADTVLTIDGKAAKWDGQKLIVTRALGPTAVTQTLSLDNGKLSIVAVFSPEGLPSTTTTYQKK